VPVVVAVSVLDVPPLAVDPPVAAVPALDAPPVAVDPPVAAVLALDVPPAAVDPPVATELLVELAPPVAGAPPEPAGPTHTLSALHVRPADAHVLDVKQGQFNVPFVQGALDEPPPVAGTPPLEEPPLEEPPLEEPPVAFVPPAPVDPPVVAVGSFLQILFALQSIPLRQALVRAPELMQLQLRKPSTQVDEAPAAPPVEARVPPCGLTVDALPPEEPGLTPPPVF
jgi:hypothetical protein